MVVSRITIFVINLCAFKISRNMHKSDGPVFVQDR